MVESSGTLRDFDLREQEEKQYAQISALAVAGLILGLLVAPVGLVLSAWALIRIRKSKGALAGAPLAVLGVILATGVIVAFLVWSQGKARQRREGIEASRQAVERFFERTYGGYIDEAWALLVPQGQQETSPDDLRNLQAQLRSKGPIQSVAVENTSWLRGAQDVTVARSVFEVVHERQTDRWEIETYPIDGRWRIAGIKPATEGPPPGESDHH